VFTCHHCGCGVWCPCLCLCFVATLQHFQIEVAFGIWTTEYGTSCLVCYDLFGSTRFVESKCTIFLAFMSCTDQFLKQNKHEFEHIWFCSILTCLTDVVDYLMCGMFYRLIELVLFFIFSSKCICMY